MINKLLNQMRLQAQMVSANFANTRIGTISSYDPNTYSVKVLLQPDGTESGWLPLGTGSAGSGSGLFTPPPIGTAVQVHFQEGNGEAGMVGMSHYNDSSRPVGGVAPGEFWFVHSTGSVFKITGDGAITLSSNGTLNITAGNNAVLNITGNVNLTASGNVNLTAPQVAITGNLLVTGNISATGTVADQTGTMSIMRTDYNTHTHGGGPTALPQMT